MNSNFCELHFTSFLLSIPHLISLNIKQFTFCIHFFPIVFNQLQFHWLARQCQFLGIDNHLYNVTLLHLGLFHRWFVTQELSTVEPPLWKYINTLLRLFGQDHRRKNGRKKQKSIKEWVHIVQQLLLIIEIFILIMHKVFAAIIWSCELLLNLGASSTLFFCCWNLF